MTTADAPLRVFSPETTAAVTGPKPVTKTVKRAAGRKWREVLSTAWSDLRSSWFWEAHPPSMAEVWRTKVVTYDRIPFEPHRCLSIDREHPGQKFDSSGPFGQCRCPGATVEQRRKATQANWVGFGLVVGWILWNLVVSIPLTGLGYGFIWAHQHPARAGLFWVVVGTVWAGVKTAGGAG